MLYRKKWHFCGNRLLEQLKHIHMAEQEKNRIATNFLFIGSAFGIVIGSLFTIVFFQQKPDLADKVFGL